MRALVLGCSHAEGYARTPWGHFARDAHSAFADYILAN
jgi:hypothetical protein